MIQKKGFLISLIFEPRKNLNLIIFEPCVEKIDGLYFDTWSPDVPPPKAQDRCYFSNDFERQCNPHGIKKTLFRLSAEQCLIECEKLEWCDKVKWTFQ